MLINIGKNVYFILPILVKIYFKKWIIEMWDETRYPRRNSLNRNVNLIWMKKLNLVVLWSISTEVVVKAIRGCAVPREQCRQSSKKIRTGPWGGLMLEDGRTEESVEEIEKEWLKREEERWGPAGTWNPREERVSRSEGSIVSITVER